MIAIGLILIMSAICRGGNLISGSLWAVLPLLFVSSLLDMGLLYLFMAIFGQ